MCSANLFFYQCFTEYQLMTWKLEMNNIIDIFHLKIQNYDEEVDDTLTKCIQKKRTYSMKDHLGCFLRINREGINIISIAYYDPSVYKYFKGNSNNKNNLSSFSLSPNKNSNINNINDDINIIYEYKNDDSNDNSNNNQNLINDINNNELEGLFKKNTFETLSEAQSNLGSVESISNANKNNDDINPWIIKYLDDSYNNNPSIYLSKTTPVNFGFSFYHVIKGDYQLYLYQQVNYWL